MTKIIVERCIKCSACLSTCKKGVILSKGIDIFIDPKRANECETCKKECIMFCPTAAITD